MTDILRIENLTFSYEENPVLDIQQISFPEKKITAITGPNGSGKTTLLKIIAGIIHPLTGTFYFKEKPIPGKPEDSLKKLSVLVHQRPYLFSGTVRKNIRMGTRTSGTRKSANDRTDELLDKFILTGLGDKKVSCLSGGEKQKVALARAVGLQRTILLLDEPEVHIDSETRKAMEHILKDLALEGKHIIFSTHDNDFARRISGQIIRLKSGTIEGVTYS